MQQLAPGVAIANYQVSTALLLLLLYAA